MKSYKSFIMLIFEIEKFVLLIQFVILYLKDFYLAFITNFFFLPKMDFPKNSDFISEGDDISDNVDLLTSEIILPLMEKPVDEYDAETKDFLENELPRIWKTIVLFSHPSRGLSNKIMLFIFLNQKFMNQNYWPFFFHQYK